MAIKKSDLYSSLWASCDELRGGMDARVEPVWITIEQQLGSSRPFDPLSAIA